jgi:diguanylate cyclase (GGDEF)-like protein
VFRLGGEEFLVLLTGMEIDGAIDVAERIRQSLETSPIRLGDRGTRRVTASFGVAEYRPREHTWSQLVRLADDAMYAAKRNGRNRVETSDPLEPTLATE